MRRGPKSAKIATLARWNRAAAPYQPADGRHRKGCRPARPEPQRSGVPERDPDHISRFEPVLSFQHQTANPPKWQA